jgi:hypothetical protein
VLRQTPPTDLPDAPDTACVAGCYRCLLSYYNQPDHELIDRRNHEVLQILVAMSNAAVRPAPNAQETPAGSPQVPRLHAWREALAGAGLRKPDATMVAVNGGAAHAAAQYKAARALVFLEPMDEATTTLLQEKGWQVLDFAIPERWAAQFAAHPEVFGPSGASS